MKQDKIRVCIPYPLLKQTTFRSSVFLCLFVTGGEELRSITNVPGCERASPLPPSTLVSAYGSLATLVTYASFL